MLPDMQTLIDAGRLIQWALRPHARPATEEEYQYLVDRYRDLVLTQENVEGKLEREVLFRECVQAICRGLGVAVTAAGQRGVVLTPDDDSVFAMTAEDYRRSGGTDDRLIDGFILIAILATFYPRAQDLEEDPLTVRQPVTIEEVEQTYHLNRTGYDKRARGRRASEPGKKADTRADVSFSVTVYPNQQGVSIIHELDTMKGNRLVG